MEQIYREYSQPVYRYCCTLTRRADLAEELTQEVFFEAVRCIHRYDGSCKLVVWLCQIAKHKWYDWLKKQKVRQMVDLDELEQQPAAQPGPEQAIDQKEAAARIYRCIHRLAPEAREIVLLRLLTGFSFREIGQIVGQSENAARVNFYRAKTKLAQWLQEEGN